LSWGIPLYGDRYQLHDFVVQSAGAFAETLRGIYSLQDAGQRIEIRIVLLKPVVERLMQLARYIYRNMPFVEHVAFMGIEPIGFAKANRDALWIDPVDFAAELQGSIGYLNDRGVPASIYNLPLCVLPRELRKHARRSISTWKQDYLEVCDACAVKSACGGFFSWVTPEWTSRSIAPVMEGECHA